MGGRFDAVSSPRVTFPSSSGRDPGQSPETHLAVSDGVRVSFENSTVCRACFFGLFLCQFCCLFCQGFVGEFDPGSGRTLAACLTHASRAHLLLSGGG
jgi:hypothetical protein